MAQEQRQEQVRDAIKAATPKPAPSRPLDVERTMTFDSRDPRQSQLSGHASGPTVQ